MSSGNVTCSFSLLPATYCASIDSELLECNHNAFGLVLEAYSGIVIVYSLPNSTLRPPMECIVRHSSASDAEQNYVFFFDDDCFAEGFRAFLDKGFLVLKESCALN